MHIIPICFRNIIIYTYLPLCLQNIVSSMSFTWMLKGKCYKIDKDMGVVQKMQEHGVKNEGRGVR